jgi:hypothetical protein
MIPIAVNEHLAHLLQVQGGLLDAYLEQNLGARYAYCIMVWEQAPPSRLRVVTNMASVRKLRAILKGFTPGIRDNHSGAPLELERAPVFVDAEEN